MFPCSPPDERGACVETRTSINSRAKAVAKSLDSFSTWMNQGFWQKPRGLWHLRRCGPLYMNFSDAGSFKATIPFQRASVIRPAQSIVCLGGPHDQFRNDFNLHQDRSAQMAVGFLERN